MQFNKGNRAKNIVKTSTLSMICNIVNLVFGFGYRTLFIRILSAEYLGINGLFTNILGILSLADLGINVSIVYRLYKPIDDEDVEQVGKVMNFLSRVYHVIMLVILVLGLSIMPFLHSFINSSSRIPPDVNLNVVYFLFLIQTCSSYLFAYKQLLLTADQRQHAVTILQTILNFLKYIAQIIVLVEWRNYTLSLVVGISITIIINFLISLWITKVYDEVFRVKESITKAEKKQIYDDTQANMLHKIGGTILSFTDNIILSKFIGLMATGMYSNYSMIFTTLNQLTNQIFGSFTSSLGNAHINLDKKEEYHMFYLLITLNFWVVSFITCCLFVLLNDFITVWVGKSMIFNKFTVLVFSLQFYLEMIRVTASSYTNATGLFTKDRIRPIIEATINIVVSILLVKKIGVPGVFLGTIISHLLTVSWREPYILYKYAFNEPLYKYLFIFLKYSFILILGTVLSLLITSYLFVRMNLFMWILKAITTVVIFTCVSLIVLRRSEELKYYVHFMKNKIKVLKSKL